MLLNNAKTRASYFDKGKPRETVGRKAQDPSLAGPPGYRVEVKIVEGVSVDPRVINKYFYAIFVAMFSVLATAAAMASFGATADGEFVMAILFTIVTAITVNLVWAAYDSFQAMIR